MTHRVLVAEDEPAIADTITYALRTEGYEVSWCPTAGKTLRAWRVHRERRNGTPRPRKTQAPHPFPAKRRNGKS